MSNIFMQGDEVAAIFFDDNEESVIRVGINNCTAIKVIMENGQMAGVPWFEVYENGALRSKWNGAKLAGVMMLSEQSQ